VSSLRPRRHHHRYLAQFADILHGQCAIVWSTVPPSPISSAVRRYPVRPVCHRLVYGATITDIKHSSPISCTASGQSFGLRCHHHRYLAQFADIPHGQCVIVWSTLQPSPISSAVRRYPARPVCHRWGHGATITDIKRSSPISRTVSVSSFSLRCNHHRYLAQFADILHGQCVMVGATVPPSPISSANCRYPARPVCHGWGHGATITDI